MHNAEDSSRMRPAIVVRVITWGLGLLAPFAVQATSSVALRWAEVEMANVAGFEIAYGPASGSYTNIALIGPVTEATISGLVEGATYFFAVKAYGYSGLESDYSNEAVYQVPIPTLSLTPEVQGVYSGLFREAEAVRWNSAGSFTVAVTKGGAFSGRLQLGGKTYALSGRLDVQCRANNVIHVGGKPALSVQWRLGPGDLGIQLVGTITDGNWRADLAGDRAESNPMTQSAGKYTWRLAGQDGDPSMPAGDGIGVVRVSSAGRTLLAGTLADGATISQAALISARDRWPVCVALYSGQGLLLGWLSFANRPTDDLNGQMTWLKPASGGSIYYPSGFGGEFEATGSAYAAPMGASILALNLNEARLTFAGGDLAAPFANLVAVSPAGSLVNLGSNRLRLGFSRSTGLFQGTVTDPSTGKSLSFRGATFQKSNTGSGFLLESGQSSRVSITQ